MNIGDADVHIRAHPGSLSIDSFNPWVAGKHEREALEIAAILVVPLEAIARYCDESLIAATCEVSDDVVRMAVKCYGRHEKVSGMNRRSLVTLSILAGVQAGRLHPVVAQEESTPAAIEPIELADGLFLVNHRFVAIGGGSITAFVGDYLNETGSDFDSPVLGMTFYDADDNIVGTGYATPVLPIAFDGELVPLKGEFYEFDPANDEYDSVEFAVCDPLEPGYASELADSLNVELEDVIEELDQEEEEYLVTGKVRNNADTPAENIEVTVIFRDQDDRFVGSTFAFINRAVPPGKTYAFEADVNVNSLVPFDPFDLAESEIVGEVFLGPSVSVYGISCS